MPDCEALQASRKDASPESSGLAKLAQGAAATLGLRIYGAALQYLTQLYFARAIGAEEMGVYAFAWTCSTLLAFLTPLGFDTSIVRFIPTDADRGDWAKVRGILSLAHRYTLRTSGLAAVFALLTVLVFDGKLDSPYAWPVLVGIALMPVLSLLNLYQGVARSFQWVAQIAGPAYFVRPTLFLGFAAIAIEALDRRTGTYMIYAAVAACVATLAMQYVRYRQRLPREVVQAEPDTSERATWLRTSLPMVLVASFELMLANTDILMMGLIRGPAETGVYNIAVRTASCLLFVLFAVTAFAQPRIATLFSQRAHGALMRFVRQMRWWIFAPTALGAVLLYFFGEHFFGFFDREGREFVYAYAPALILTAGILVRAIAGPVDSLLTMTGRERSLAAGLALAAVVNLVGNALLIPHWGAVGAASATATSVVLEVLLISYLASRHIGFTPFLLRSGDGAQLAGLLGPATSGLAEGPVATPEARAPASTKLRFEVVTDAAGLDALEPEWTRFEREVATRDQFFQTWLWNRKWWEHFSHDANTELRVLVGREDGRLAVLLPMVEVRRGPISVLEPTGGLLSCFGDALVAERADQGALLEETWRFVKSIGTASAIHFPAVHERAKLAPLLLAQRDSLIEENASPEIRVADFADMDAYLASRSKRFRKDLRRSLKKLEAVGRVELTPHETRISPTQAVTHILDFKRAWIRDNGLPARTVVSEQGEAFLADYCEALAARRDGIAGLALSSLRVDERLGACGIAFEMRDARLEYLGGFDHELKKLGAGKVQLAASVRDTWARGAVSCNLLTPRTEFKAHWTEDAPAVRQHFVPTTWQGRLYRRLYLKTARPMLKQIYNATVPRIKRRLS